MGTNSNAPSLWAHFRFSIVGPLLSCPAPRGELNARIEALAGKVWRHPVTGDDVRFSAVTIARWYYKALKERHDPVRVLRRAIRKDAGKISLSPRVAATVFALYRAYPHWTYQLHHDNLQAALEADPTLGALPSYATLRRYMKAKALLRTKRRPDGMTAGEREAATRIETREVRSFEVEHVGSLWHLDFHHGSRKVLTQGGEWVRPIAIAIIDDHCRLVCHLQWYLFETAEVLVHALCQAIQKRGLPRMVYHDRGAAMKAEEVIQGLQRLGILQRTTLGHSPYQNGKQEAFWGPLEGRLVAMLYGLEDLRLEFLNQATQAWAELEYNRARHSEIGETPVDRFARGPDVLRPSPTSEELRLAFRLEVSRSQRQSDGTISIEGVRFEVPNQYRHFRRVSVRYARWDRRLVHLVDPQTGALLTPVYPLDRARNADGIRRTLEVPLPHPIDPDSPIQPGTLPPLLSKLLRDYTASGLPPAYIPFPEKPADGDEDARGSKGGAA
jgi:transposase InsO family protein